MSDLRVADESGGQTDLTAGGVQTSHAGHGEQPVKRGRMGETGGVSRPGRSQTVAVENKKEKRFHYGH